MRQFQSTAGLTRSVGIMLALSLLGCSSSMTAPDAQPVVQPAMEAATSYLVAKRSYVDALDKTLRVHQTASDPYRLVAVAGPQWPIGAVLDPDNPLNQLTKKCEVASAALPTEWTAWSNLPTLTQSRTIALGAGLPRATVQLLGKAVSAGANVDLSKSGQFALTDLRSKILPQDDFESGLSPDCKAFLKTRGGVVVRGIVSGKEVFKSITQIDMGAGVKWLEEDVLRLKYDNKGNFELEDEAPVPKMYLVAYFARETRGVDGPSGIMPPTDAQLRALEKLGLQ